MMRETEFCRKPCFRKREFCYRKYFKRQENCRSQMCCGIRIRDEVFHLNKLYEDYIREKVHEQLIEMAKRMLEDNALSLLSKNDEVLETSMDDIEIQIVKDYLKKNRKFLEE